MNPTYCLHYPQPVPGVPGIPKKKNPPGVILLTAKLSPGDRTLTLSGSLELRLNYILGFDISRDEKVEESIILKSVNHALPMAIPGQIRGST